MIILVYHLVVARTFHFHELGVYGCRVFEFETLVTVPINTNYELRITNYYELRISNKYITLEIKKETKAIKREIRMTDLTLLRFSANFGIKLHLVRTRYTKIRLEIVDDR